MTKKDFVEIMYMKHGKMSIELKDAAPEFGKSKSSVEKLFGGRDSLSEDFILEKKMIPRWFWNGNKRMWKLKEIADWHFDTEAGNFNFNEYLKQLKEESENGLV